MTALLRSAPQMPVPLRPLAGSIALLWLAPCAVGWILAACLRAGAGILPPEWQLAAYGLVYLCIFSPVFSWIGWLLAAPLIWFLLRDGWFGWVSAALTGAVVGATAGGLVGTAAGLPFGILALLVLRAVLGRTLALSPASTL